MIIIIRHGQTIWNKEKRKQGQSDSPLTLKGIEQAQNVAHFIKEKLDINIYEFDLYTSPLFRTMQFSSIFLEEIGIEYSRLQKHNLLKEHSFGMWEGLTEEEIEIEYSGFLKKRYENWWEYIVPSGESYQLIFNRAKKFLKETTAHNMIIFTHEMISKVLRGAYLSMDTKSILELEHPHDTIYILDKKNVKAYDICTVY